MKVFVSYRREDSAAYAGRLCDALGERLGAAHVFHDVSAIGPGEDFRVSIERALEEADATLVVIGPAWHDVSDRDGARRLDDPDDYVRFEVVRALARDAPVVPVLVGGASLPSPTDVPEDLRPLLNRQATVVRDETWHDDVAGLLRRLRAQVSGPRPRRRWLVAAAAVLVLGVVASVATFVLSRQDGGTAGPVVAACEEPSEPRWSRLLGPDASSSVSLSTEEGSYEVTVTDGYYRESQQAGRWTVVLTTVLENVDDPDAYQADWIYERLTVDGFPNEPATCFFTTRPNPSVGERSDARVGFDVDMAPAGKSLQLIVNINEVERTVDLGTGEPNGPPG